MLKVFQLNTAFTLNGQFYIHLCTHCVSCSLTKQSHKLSCLVERLVFIDNCYTDTKSLVLLSLHLLKIHLLITDFVISFVVATQIVIFDNALVTAHRWICINYNFRIYLPCYNKNQNFSTNYQRFHLIFI